MTVLGIDPSLTSTGVAYRKADGKIKAFDLGFKNLRGLLRVQKLREALAVHMDIVQPSLVVYEGYALGFRGKSNTIFDLGELGGQLKLMVLERGVDLLVVPPTTLKKFVTGNGGAGKDEVKVALQTEFGLQFTSSDQYDAAGLLMMGEAVLDPRRLPRDRRHHKRAAILGCQTLKAAEFV